MTHATQPSTGVPETLSDKPPPEDVWYQDGLRFSCTQCGDCCRGLGYVWLDEEMVNTLAEHLGLSPDEFSEKYVRKVGARLCLTDKPNYDCIFWDDDAGCEVYEVRPAQCRTFPFWPENLESPRTWERTEKVCPGSGKGRLYPIDQIKKVMRGEAEVTETED